MKTTHYLTLTGPVGQFQGSLYRIGELAKRALEQTSGQYSAGGIYTYFHHMLQPPQGTIYSVYCFGHVLPSGTG
jgi:hypothetical protein